MERMSKVFKQRGEKVSFEEIVVNSKKGGEEMARRKLRVESLGEMIAKEVMDVASLLPKNGNNGINDNNSDSYSLDENEDEESVKEENNHRNCFTCA